MVIRIGAICLALVLGNPARAQTGPAGISVAVVEPAALETVVATAPDLRAEGPGMTIDEQMDAYIEANGFAARERLGELSVLRGVATVLKPSSDPQWVAFRSLAFEAALLDAQADFAIKQNAQITAETISNVYRAAGQEPPEYKPSDSDTTATGELIRKLQALGTAQLDKALRELNIDPTTYERAPQPQRHVQMQNALRQKVTTAAFEKLTGLAPVQTFEKPVGQDIYKIGVVAVVSSKMKDFAQRVLTERGNFAPAPEHAGRLGDIVADKSKLLLDFGVRWRYDEAGLPVLVSFAQWASDYRGQDPVSAERYKDIAYRQAEQKADGQIADFLKGSVSVRRTTDTAQTETEAADRSPDGYVAQQAAMRKLLSGYQSDIRRQSQVSITGLTTLLRWTFKHPDTGQTVIGVIRIWSAAGEKATRILRDGRPATPSAPPAATSGPGVGQAGRKLMDASDF